VAGLLVGLGGGSVTARAADPGGEVAANGAPNVLTLEEAIRRGLEASPAMRRAQLRLELAQLELRRAEVNVRATVTPLELEDARKAVERAEHQLQLARVEVALDVERLYYGVLRARDTLSLRRNATERAARQLDIARRRHASGQVTELQLREVEQNLSVAELAEREAEHRLHMAWMALRQAIGDTAWEMDGEIELEHEIALAREEVDIEQALADAQERRLEVLFARQAVEDAQRAVRLADNDYTPRVELQRARIALSEAELALAEAEAQVRREVWDAAIRLQEAEGRYELALERLALASDQLDLAELRYHNGLNTVLDVLTAESVLAAAETEAVAAHYDYNIARAEYLRARGRGFDRWPHLLGGEGTAAASGADGAVGAVDVQLPTGEAEPARGQGDVATTGENG